nr:50S ribosomal protein L22 [Anaerolineae bacterium]
MEVRATSKHLPISPQKIRLVCDLVRGMEANEAADLLRHMPQKGAGLLLKTLNSALANAENNFELDPNLMVITQVYANEGPRRPWRRFGARGRFKPITRRTSHLTVVLSEREPEAVTAGKED